MVSTCTSFLPSIPGVDSLRASECSHRRGRVAALCLVLAAAGSLLLAALPAFASGAATTTALAVTSGGSAVTTVSAGGVVTLTATVMAATSPLTVGQVNFCDATAKYCTDIHLLASAQLTKAGTATYKFRPGVGSHSYKAVFVGTTSDVSSTSASALLTVTQTGLYPTTATVSNSGKVGNYTLAAKVGGVGQTPPTGTISFLDKTNNDAVLSAIAVTKSTASISFFNSSRASCKIPRPR